MARPRPVVSDRGERYESAADAALSLGGNRRAVAIAISEGKRFRGRSWRYDEDVEAAPSSLATRRAIEAKARRRGRGAAMARRKAEALGKAGGVAVGSPKAKVIGYLSDLARLVDSEPLDRSDPASCEERGLAYLRLCGQADVWPNVAGLAIAFDMSRSSYLRIANGEAPEGSMGTTRASAAVMRRFCAMLDASLEASMLEERGNPAKWIFLAKNNHGYVDVKQQVVARHDVTDGLPDAKAVAAKYAEIVDVSTEDGDGKALGEGPADAPESA